MDLRLDSRGLTVFSLMALLAGTAGNAPAQAYTALDLGSLIAALPGGLGSASNATAINASGQVAGTSTAGGFNAFLYSGGSVTELGFLHGGTISYARAINSSGQIVGAADAGGGVYHAFLYSSGSMTDLGTLPGGSNSSAYGINVSGQVVGSSDGASAGQHAFLYSAGGMTDLGTLPGGSTSYAFGINDSGQVVGYSQITGGAERAFLYSAGIMTDLGTLPGGTTSRAYAINNSGQVAGYAGFAGGAQHAFLYSSGSMTDLGTLPGGSNSSALGINNSAQVVGYSDTAAGAQHAFLYSSGSMTDLNNDVALPRGTVLTQASAINDSGLIAASGDDAYLLTPRAAITIHTSPEGLQFKVDGGVAQIAPQTVYLTQGAHTVAVTTTTQAGAAGTQYVFTGWGGSSEASLDITVGASAATYTASFKTQYQLTTSALPGAEGAVTPATGQFYDSGTAVTVTATPVAPNFFFYWSGAAPGTANPITVTMDGAKSVTGNFASSAFTCQPMGDQMPNVADVQFLTIEALGAASPLHDLDGDGAISVVDVQIELNAVLYKSCTTK